VNSHGSDCGHAVHAIRGRTSKVSSILPPSKTLNRVAGLSVCFTFLRWFYRSEYTPWSSPSRPVGRTGALSDDGRSTASCEFSKRSGSQIRSSGLTGTVRI